MPGLLRGIARTAVVAGTATAVSNRVSRRQAGRWAAEDQRDAFYAAQAAPPVAPAPVAPPAPAAPALSMDERLAQLTQLAALKDQGVLTDAEFAAQKAQILSS
ncbi:SHOCT domain-containing protein [Nocardioides dubius]|uniref:SHOCT domain-containing protein n=1 Tax=Nocardioides dubius TaxID=317019 RepID=A0ABP4EH19_9ACTN